MSHSNVVDHSPRGTAGGARRGVATTFNSPPYQMTRSVRTHFVAARPAITPNPAAAIGISTSAPWLANDPVTSEISGRNSADSPRKFRP
jgi:hypothetical protein